jgi:hypothetical protein
MKALIFAAVILASGSYAYRNWQPTPGLVEDQLARANALSILRTVETFQYFYWTDKDDLAISLDEMNRYGGGGNDAIKALAAASKSAQPYKGFLMKEVTRSGSYGDTLYGLLLLPAGQSSGKGYAILIDMSKIQIDDRIEGAGRSSGQAGSLYVLPSPAAGAISGWPSDTALAQWEKIERLTPQQGLARAQGMAGSVGQLK